MDGSSFAKHLGHSSKPLPTFEIYLPSCRKLHFKSIEQVLKKTMLSILRKARLKDKEMRILMLSVVRH